MSAVASGAAAPQSGASMRDEINLLDQLRQMREQGISVGNMQDRAINQQQEGLSQEMQQVADRLMGNIAAESQTLEGAMARLKEAKYPISQSELDALAQRIAQLKALKATLKQTLTAAIQQTQSRRSDLAGTAAAAQSLHSHIRSSASSGGFVEAAGSAMEAQGAQACRNIRS